VNVIKNNINLGNWYYSMCELVCDLILTVDHLPLNAYSNPFAHQPFNTLCGEKDCVSLRNAQLALLLHMKQIQSEVIQNSTKDAVLTDL
jgi:hypothetical protein